MKHVADKYAEVEIKIAEIQFEREKMENDLKLSKLMSAMSEKSEKKLKTIENKTCKGVTKKPTEFGSIVGFEN